ncbi:MDIS1-interacting receptor like kinase 2 [Vitis vinifera]|uniref:non-specific serine/threonine protein kinase n=1 Tax=Vitis vinifera TaxID=29760 RepID=A0A438KAG8_VITVI|nr:MDIS1-interacting receptor like kinase 2 [Vitis vinifera]
MEVEMQAAVMKNTVAGFAETDVGAGRVMGSAAEMGIMVAEGDCEWGGCGRRRRRSGALNGNATGGDAVSDSAWQLGGKEWCCGVSGDGGRDCAAEAASRAVAENALPGFPAPLGYVDFFRQCSSYSNEETQALLKWKASLHNQNHSSLLSWTLYPNNFTNSSTHLGTEASPCKWYGISCNHAGSVIRINLTESGLGGTLQAFSFSSFPNLAYVDVCINNLSGPIPPQIGLLSKLKYLDLSTNQFSGGIPPEIGLLTNLEVLHLVQNQLNGSIPHEIGQLSSLYELALYTNQLEGSIPASLGNLSNLASLYLYENQLSDSIPPEMGNLTNLVEIYSDTNNLTGPIPSTFGNLKRLTVLYLFNNRLSGHIPPEIGNLKSLQGLSLYGNNLSGPIPVSLCNLKSLVDLELSENQLNGSIPTSLVGCARNGHKQLFGSLPEGICQGGSLVRFTVSDNHLSGPIPKSLKNCRNLTRALFQGNQLTGNISEVVGDSPNLEYIDLSYNRFHGELSHNWGRCPQLQRLEIAGNNITGSIPEDFGISTNLALLDLSSNHLVGEIPKKLGSVTSLWKLILNDNQLSGNIPPELGSLSDLGYLDLSANRLNGSIPEHLGDCLGLNYLNLSNNKLSHRIPVQLGKLNHLSQLDLSHNLLTGGIPPQIQGSHSHSNAFRNATIEVLKGNKDLCGNVKGLQPCKYASGVDQQPVKKSHKKRENSRNRKKVRKGGHGSVYKAELPSSNIVAVKKLHPSDTEMANQKDFLNEIRALTEIKHRNMVKLLGFCSHPRHMFLVYEYLERGSLATILSREEAKKLGWATRYEAHISDFGTAKLLKLDSSIRAYLQHIRISCTSFGVIALEVIKGRHPGDQILSLSVSPEKDNIALEDMLDPRLPPLTPQDEEKVIAIIKLATACLNANPQSRPTMQIVSQMLSQRK